MRDAMKFGVLIGAALALAVMAATEATSRRTAPLTSVGDCPAVVAAPPDGDPALLSAPAAPGC